MSVKQENLAKILKKHFHLAIDPLPKLRWEQLKKHPALPAVREVYADLGGRFKNPGVFLPPWDFMLENVAVQWDDALHFNKYRLATLRSPLYENCRAFQIQRYRSYCQKHQPDCLKMGLAGDRWNNPQAEKQFGPSEAPGDLGGYGSAAWKQRAFNDYLQDMSMLVLNQPLVRLSPYEELLVGGKLSRLDDLLFNPSENEEQMLARHIGRRIEVAMAFYESD